MEYKNKKSNPKSLEENVEDLARLTKGGFDQMQDEMRKGFGLIHNELTHINARLDLLERDVSHIRKHFVSRDEFDELFFRVQVIEKRLGIEGQ